MRRRICILTGSRAEYGLLRRVMDGIRDSDRLSLQVVATGMHLSPEFGLTASCIEKDGFAIDERIEVLLSADTPTAIAKAMGLGLIGFSDALARLRPHWLVLLGDRFEIFAAAAAALVARIPIAHLHGGELTEGAFDDALRHSITKMAQLHFVATEDYRRRVIQLGEAPETVFNVGGLGVDAMKAQPLLERVELEASLGFRLGRRNLLVTFHPVTLETATSAQQMKELLAALAALRDTELIFTLPNADTEGRDLIRLIEEFAAANRNAHVFCSLGQQRYWSCLRQVDAIVGNSSSGLLEAPSFRKPTVNIGERQRGRLKARSVIDCAPTRQAITEALALAYSSPFQLQLAGVQNPYGEGGASVKIVHTLEKMNDAPPLKKTFFDVPFVF